MSEVERFQAALDGQRRAWDHLQVANREALRPLAQAVSEPWIPLEDWQRAVINQVAEARRYHAAQYARHRHRVVHGTAAAAIALNMALYGEAHITVPSQADQYALDPTPDRCWRCDASPGTDDLGLCEPCRASLTKGTA